MRLNAVASEAMDFASATSAPTVERGILAVVGHLAPFRQRVFAILSKKGVTRSFDRFPFASLE